MKNGTVVPQDATVALVQLAVSTQVWLPSKSDASAVESQAENSLPFASLLFNAVLGEVVVYLIGQQSFLVTM